MKHDGIQVELLGDNVRDQERHQRIRRFRDRCALVAVQYIDKGIPKRVGRERKMERNHASNYPLA